MKKTISLLLTVIMVLSLLPISVFASTYACPIYINDVEYDTGATAGTNNVSLTDYIADEIHNVLGLYEEDNYIRDSSGRYLYKDYDDDKEPACIWDMINPNGYRNHNRYILETPEVISFTINGISYEARDIDTFQSWVYSDNNTLQLIEDQNGNGYITNEDGTEFLKKEDGERVEFSEYIYNYSTLFLGSYAPTNLVTFKVNDIEYSVPTDMGWDEWVTSEYNIHNFNSKYGQLCGPHDELIIQKEMKDSEYFYSYQIGTPNTLVDGAEYIYISDPRVYVNNESNVGISLGVDFFPGQYYLAYSSGELVQLFIKAHTGYTFDSWSVTKKSDGTPISLIENTKEYCTFYMPNEDVYADVVNEHTYDTYAVTDATTAENKELGSLEIMWNTEKITEAPYDSTVTVKVMPNVNMSLSQLTVLNTTMSSPVSLNSSTTNPNEKSFVMPDAPVSVAAVFEAEPNYDLYFEVGSKKYELESYYMQAISWVNSEYNRDGFYFDNGKLYSADGEVVLDKNENTVGTTDMLWDRNQPYGEGPYTLVECTFTLDGVTYNCGYNQDWNSWCSSANNDLGLIYKDGFISTSDSTKYVFDTYSSRVGCYENIELGGNYYTDEYRISFTIDGEVFYLDYNYEPITDWVNSANNTKGIVADGDFFKTPDGKYLVQGTERVQQWTQIYEYVSYNLQAASPISFTIGGVEYSANQFDKFKDWLDSDNNTDGFKKDKQGWLVTSDGSQYVVETQWDDSINRINDWTNITDGGSYDLHTPSTFSFTINGTPYNFKEFENFESWMKSANNTIENLEVKNNYLYIGSEILKQGEQAVGAYFELHNGDSYYTAALGTISFKIDGVTYTAQQYQTLKDWVKSDYNTIGLKLVGENKITNSDGSQVLTQWNNMTYANNEIQENTEYNLTTPATYSFTIDGKPYSFKEFSTIGEWVGSAYNTDGFKLVENKGGQGGTGSTAGGQDKVQMVLVSADNRPVLRDGQWPVMADNMLQSYDNGTAYTLGAVIEEEEEEEEPETPETPEDDNFGEADYEVDEAGEDGQTMIIVDSTPTIFKASVPVKIAVNQAGNGEVTVLGDYTVDNLCPAGPILITNISVVAAPDWNIVDFNSDFKNMVADTKSIGLKINDIAVGEDGSVEMDDSLTSSILHDSSKTLTFDAALSARKTAFEGNVAAFVFTLDFDKVN